MENGSLDPHLDVFDGVWAIFNKSCGVKYGFAVFLSLEGCLNEALVLDQLVDGRHLVGLRCVTQVDSTLQALLSIN